MSKLFVVSDIHGYLEAFQEALRAAGLVNARGDWAAPYVDFCVLGDVIDRGPDSKGVVDYLMKLREQAFGMGSSHTWLLGNHEQMMLVGPKVPASGQCWWEHGGVECLLSYGLGPGSRYNPQQTHAIVREHKAFYFAMESHKVVGDTLLVHAGAPVNRKLADLDKVVDHLWVRPSQFLRADPQYLKRQYGVDRVVFGHSPLTPGGVTNIQGGRFLCIDSGSFLPGGAVAVVELLPDFGHRLAGLGSTLNAAA